MFKRLDNSLSIKDSVYINYKECKDELLKKGERQIVHVEIQGFKKPMDNFKPPSPIWQVLHEKKH